MELPEGYGDEIYRQAYTDGCKTSFGAFGATFYQPFNKWTQDPFLAQTDRYYLVWRGAYTYCGIYALVGQQHGFGNFK